MAEKSPDQRTAFRDFKNAAAWRREKGKLTLELDNGTLIDIMEVIGGHWQPIVTTPGEMPQYCYSVDSLDEAKEEAWTCYEQLLAVKEATVQGHTGANQV